MRIVSFLPSATEIVCALGLEKQLVGVSHECDYPPEVKSKPRVVKTLIETAGRTPADIDRQVSQTMRERGTLYVADEPLLRELAPDLVLTQDLCKVCAPSGDDLNALVRRLPTQPKVLSLNPKSVDDILDNILDVARATGRDGSAVVERLRRRIDAARPSGIRVAVLEWLDPTFTAGHWVPEMVERAGGVEVLGRKHDYSRRIEWADVERAAPEIVVLAPCGYHLDKVLEQAPLVLKRITWPCRAYAVDADSYFARPGPRVVDGVELLTHLLHGRPWTGPADAFKAVAP